MSFAYNNVNGRWRERSDRLTRQRVAKLKCVCGAIVAEPGTLCPSCVGSFVIRRDPVAGLHNPKPRYNTTGYGWSANLKKAKRYATAAEAEIENRTRDRVVALVDEVKGAQ